MRGMRLEYQKSYLRLFGLFAALILGGTIISIMAHRRPLWVFDILPVFALFLLVSQLRSGIALDSFWVAAHKSGTGMYKVLIAWNFLIAVLMLAMAVMANLN